MSLVSDVKADFDRLAAFDTRGWTANNHYHKSLLRHVPPDCVKALEIGCGTGAFSRRLAARSKQVLALDLSTEMIRVARERAVNHPNILFEANDALERDFPLCEYDCIAAIATLHHLDQRSLLARLKQSLKPGGTLIVLDLLATNPGKAMSGIADAGRNVFALGLSCVLSLIHNGRLRMPREVRAAWEQHGKSDTYLTLNEVRELYQELLPGVVVRRHLLWRYSAVWTKCD